MIDFQVTEEEEGLLSTAARFGEERLRPAERPHEEARRYPEALVHEYRELGLGTLGLPEALGGAALAAPVQVAVRSELAAADPAAPLGLDPLGPGCVALASTPAGRALIAEAREGAVAVAEGIRVEGGRARGRVGWLPRGGLHWLVLADDRGVYRVDAPRWAPVAARPCGLRACGGVEVVLEDAPAESLGGADLARQVLAECRLYAGALLLGAARDAHAAAARYTQERVAFGRPIAHHQGLAFQLADAATDLEAARLLLEAAASRGHAAEVAGAHAYVTEVALRVVERSVQALGGHGYLQDHRVEKRMRDVRSLASLWGGAVLSERDAALSVLDAPEAVGDAS
ncbi:MAG: acyl-CoA dehydrogenase family protein [Planctomycetes bacterium]|nr:acyl-CoA dehydrogenase family protein [Planctomycetota bacterium]